jgi:hypothetical protein
MTLNAALDIWRNLHHVPFDETPSGANVIARDFIGFPAGTDIEDIWHWLESECHEFSAGVAMNGGAS